MASRLLWALVGTALFVCFVVFSLGSATHCSRSRYVADYQLRRLKIGLEAYHADQGRYPRTPDAHLFGDDAAGLFTALCERAADGGEVDGPYLAWDREHMGKLPVEFTDPGAMGEDGHAGVEEIVGAPQPGRTVLLDPWGNPYHYREWASIDGQVKAVLVRRGELRLGFRGPHGEVRGGVPPVAHPVYDAPHDAQAYDIWSNGPNGVNEYGAPCADDVTSWVDDAYHASCTCGYGRSTRSAPAALSASGWLLLPAGVLGGVLWGRRRRRRRLRDVATLIHVGASVESAPPPFPLVVRPRESALRCAYCHGAALDALPEAARCPGCQALLHDDCWGLARRCPTLGCRGLMRRAPPRRLRRLGWRPPWRRRGLGPR